MKKILSIIMIGMALFIGKVYAVGSDETDTGNDVSTTVKETVKTKLEEAREKRATIRTNLVELKSLRNQVRSRILETRALLNTYRNTEKLTDEQVATAKSRITAVKKVKSVLADEIKDIKNTVKQYKNDTSDSKLTGLDNVISSQEKRIAWLKEALAAFDE